MVLDDIEFHVLDTSAEADVIHIDSQATNAFANGSAQYPFHSIEEAADCAAAYTLPGEAVTLTLAPGLHYGNASISGYKLHLRSSGGAVLQGASNGPVLSFAGSMSAGSVVEGIEIRGGSGVAGGVLVTDNCSVTLQSCVLRDNHGDLAGGVAVRNSSEVILMGCQIENNTSTSGAGGIGVEGGTATVLASILVGNTSSQGGGGLWIYNSADVTLNSCLIIGNSADYGGGIMLEGGNLLLEQTRVVSNTALSNGGGLHCINSAQLELVASKVTNNSAAGNGGGICMNGGRLTGTRATLASNLGAEVYLSNNAEVFLNSSILWGGGFNQGIVNAGRQAVLGQVAFSIVDYDNFDISAGIPLQADPLFTDPFNGNHSVQGGSPAIDSGDPAIGSDSDGSAPDMGSHAVLGN
jgi:predicted outer membrane repeat protein